MKKILIILFSFLGLGFLICLIIAFCQKPSVELLNTAVGNYKFFNTLELFTKIFPAMIFTGFALACSIQFGNHSEGSFSRFSPAMFSRYKLTIIVSLICTLLLTMSTEVLSLTAKRHKTSLENQPKLVNEYIRAAQNFLDQKKPESAAAYAKEALKLNKSNKEAANIKNQADIMISMQETRSAKILYETNLDDLFTDSSSNIDTENMSQVYGLYLKAQNCWDNEEYFTAHYYAESALKISSGKDPNVSRLKEISAASWNKLSELHELARTDEQNLFMEKYDGYKALMEEDYLKAYYILKNIQVDHPELKNDSDLYFYEAIAEQKVNERSFFIDETWNLKSFESANDVYFSLKYDDSWQDIIYFKGMTQVKTTGGMVQYLRDFSIHSIDPTGKVFSSMHVPYAKVLAVSVKDINPLTKENMGIARNINYVPYILLKSIDRVNENQVIKPVYHFADKENTTGTDFIMLPVEFSDFQMIENASLNPDSIPMSSLWRIISTAEKFGYSEEVYGQVLLNRLLYPLFILFMFICLASVAWNNRLDSNSFFKASWLAVFPVFTVLAQFFIMVFNYAFKLGNYGLLNRLAPTTALIVGIGIYILLIICASLFFLSRKAE
ncbi:MAG: hypothetical protein MJ182_07615 [Treponema sp.]|nr:hypothetical protein [Treponema sp.]